MIIWDLDGVLKLLLIILAFIFVPLLWVLFRKEKATDREGREPPVPDKRLSGETQPRSNLPLYGGRDGLYRPGDWEGVGAPRCDAIQREAKERLGREERGKVDRWVCSGCVRACRNTRKAPKC